MGRLVCLRNPDTLNAMGTWRIANVKPETNGKGSVEVRESSRTVKKTRIGPRTERGSILVAVNLTIETRAPINGKLVLTKRSSIW